MAISWFKLLLPVACFIAYISPPLQKWIKLIFLQTTDTERQCPVAERYLIGLAFLIFYLAFTNALLTSFTCWLKLSTKYFLVIAEFITIFVLFCVGYVTVKEKQDFIWNHKEHEACADIYVNHSFRVFIYLASGYLIALLLRIIVLGGKTSNWKSSII